jgi:hypothetical protein
MKQILIAFLLLFVGQKSFSQDWIFVSTDSEGDKTYVKSKYVKKGDEFGNEDVIKVWLKRESKVTSIYKKGKEVKVYNAKELILREYNCNTRQTKLIMVTTYNSKGSLVDTQKIPDYEQEWQDIVPDSIGEAIIDKVCELFN